MPNQVKYGLIFCLAVALITIGYFFYNSKNENSFTREEEGLSEVQKSQYENDLAEIGTEILNPNPKTDLVNLHIKRGDLLKKLNRLDSAKLAYEDAIKTDSKRAAGYTSMFGFQIETGDLIGARENIKKYINLNPDSGSRWERYIDFEKNVAKSSVDVVNAIYSDALIQTGENIDLVTEYAKFLEEHNSMQLAKEYWIKAGVKDPENKAQYDAEIKRLDEKMAQQPAQ